MYSGFSCDAYASASEEAIEYITYVNSTSTLKLLNTSPTSIQPQH